MARILVAEDETALRDAYSFVLREAGYEVDAAPDGGMALKLLMNQPDLVLLDMMMPGISGIDFLREADIPHKHPNTKVIVLSNYSDESLKERATSMGIYKYLVKVNTTHSQMLEEVKGALVSTTEARLVQSSADNPPTEPTI
jgi:DNA-binding response OmpR family regulator